MKALRRPVRQTRFLMASVPGSNCPSGVRARQWRSRRGGGPPSGLGSLVSRAPRSGVSQVGTHRTSQVSWQSVPYLCPVPRPRPDRQNLATCGPVDAAPGPNTPKAPAKHDLEAYPGLQYPLPTLHERRCRHPCKARFRLAGCAFAGRESNPLDCDERFQITSVLLSRTFLTQAGPTRGDLSTNSTSPPNPLSPPKCSRASASSTKSRRRSAAVPPSSAVPSASSAAVRLSKPCTRGFRSSCRACPAPRRWPPPCAMPCVTGPGSCCSSTTGGWRWVESTTGAVAVGPEEWRLSGGFRQVPVPQVGP